MGVSLNGGTPTWMVKIMENPIKIGDLGGKPIILGTPPYVSEKNHFRDCFLGVDVVAVPRSYFLGIGNFSTRI